MKTMRLPSRFIPSRSTPRLGLSGVLVLIAMLLGFGYFIYSSSNLARCITAALVCAFCGYVVVINRQEKHRFKVMASSREGESICEFARSFNVRQTDTWIIRAAYQELQLLLQSYVPAFPVRASDSLLNDLKIDPDDVEDLLLDIAERSGRSLDKTENNPYYGKVRAVSDLVFFINAQPAKA
jgi:hypothetical protein